MRFRIPLVLLALAGIVLSWISLQAHYSTEPSAFCNFNATFNCDVVNKGVYSEIMGFPVALMGLVGYAAFFALSMFLSKKPWATQAMVALAIPAFLFSLYLTYIEGFVLATWCVLCIGSALAVTGILALSWTAWKRPRSVA